MIHFKASELVKRIWCIIVIQTLMGFQKYSESWINALLHHKGGRVLCTPPVNVLMMYIVVSMSDIILKEMIKEDPLQTLCNIF
jgi:hypothetical protein